METDSISGEDTSVKSGQDSERRWPEPKLPTAPEGLTKSKVKLRGVLKSLIDNETSYVSSIKRIADMKNINAFMKRILNPTETKEVSKIADEILHIHKAFNIALEEELRKIYEDGSVAKCLTLFSSDHVFGIYSNYINNCEVALETVQNLKTKKDWLRQMRVYLCSDMIKPVQRYPQLIMIIKDILKYTPHDDDARTSLQEALTGIDTVAFKLNERKRFLDQHRYGKKIAGDFPQLHLSDANACLVREDNMNKLCQLKHRPHSHRPDRRKSVTQKTINVAFFWKLRRLYLMKDTLVMIDDEQRNRSTASMYMWHQHLDKLELTTSRNILDDLTRMYSEGILGKDPAEDSFDDVYQLVDDINNIHHDVTLLNKLTEDMKALKYRHKIQPQVDSHIANLQQMRHNKEYQLMQVFYDRCIFIYDTDRQVTFAFWAPSVHVKQEWCSDFLLTKRALDPSNSPSWYEQDPHGRTGGQTALILKHIVIKTQEAIRQRLSRLNVKCAVCVKLPHGQHELIEHLWVCSSSVSTAHVSIVPMHSDDSTPVETFEVVNCNIICVERVPHTNERGITRNSVWMATSDSEIMVFVFSASRPDAHRTPINVFKPGCLVATMAYIDGKVFCGTSDGRILVYSKDGGDNWSNSMQIPFGMRSSVMSIISVGDSIWAGCGNKINLIDKKISAITELKGFQIIDDPDLHVQFLVKAGVGVWASFHGKSKLVLFHSENKSMLQELSIDRAVGEFLSACTNYDVKTKTFEVTSLVATLGSLWIGTNVGIILTYPVTRLRDGIPRINQRPQIARYGHSRPIRFLFPLRYDPVSGVSIREYQTSIVLVEQEHETEPQQEEKDDPVKQETVTDSYDLPESPYIEMLYSRTEDIECVELRASNLDSLNVTDDTDIIDVNYTKAKNRESPESFADVSISKETIDRLYSSLTGGQDEMALSDTISLPRDSKIEPDRAAVQSVSTMVNGELVSSIDGQSVSDMADGQSVSVMTTRETVPDMSAGESSNYGKISSQCNTILVVSGGNGFLEWNTQSDSNSETQESTLIFWIYKA